jgi:hypothetical protein
MMGVVVSECLGGSWGGADGISEFADVGVHLFKEVDDAGSVGF